MNAIALKPKLRAWISGAKPAVQREPATSLALAERFYEVMFHGQAGHAGVTRQDLEHAATVASTLRRILDTYRRQSAQTPEERAIGRALDHVARIYMGDHA